MTSHVTVAIIGAGFAGLAAAIRLQQEGITDVVLLERASSVGGTWRDNTYPGAACDIPSHLYSLSYAPSTDWSHAYARQPEIRAYLESLVDRFGLRERIHGDCEVVHQAFDETTSRWTLRTRTGATYRARFVINGIGALRDPAIPDLPGRDTFAGPQFHSSRWRHDLDLTDQRIGVVGTGASAIQFVPEIAPSARRTTVFQRSAPWVTPRHDRAYPPLAKAVLRHVPGARRAVRSLQYLRKELRHPLFFGPHPVLAPIAEHHLRRQLRRQLRDPELVAAATPDDRLGCKRVLISNDWYPTLRRDDVRLETTAIAAITPTGVTLADGREVALDVLVHGTGFTVDRPLGEMVVTGRGGRDLGERWGRRPTAHLGITVPGFPNSFLLLGPNTALGHNSVVIMIEAQVEYVLQAIGAVIDDPAGWVEPTEEALAAFVTEVDRRHADLTWASGCTSWYRNDDGENFTLWPGTTWEYRRRVRRFDPREHRVGGLDEPPPTQPLVTVG